MKTAEEFLREQNDKDGTMYIEPDDYLYNLMEEYTKYVLKEVLTDVEEDLTLTDLLKRVEWVQGDSNFLEILETNGVDNWVGYSECYKRHIAYNDFDKTIW